MKGSRRWRSNLLLVANQDTVFLIKIKYYKLNPKLDDLLASIAEIAWKGAYVRTQIPWQADKCQKIDSSKQFNELEWAKDSVSTQQSYQSCKNFKRSAVEWLEIFVSIDATKAEELIWHVDRER